MALPHFEEALRILRQPNVSLDTAWGRSAATVALWGYCRSADRLRRRSELENMLLEWRPTYLEWLKHPIMEAERRYLEWFEGKLEHEAAKRGMGGSDTH